MEMNSNNTTSGALTTALQYATIAAVGYGIYYTRQKSNARQAPEPARAAPETETRSEKSAKKQRVQQYAQDAASQKQAPAKTQPKATESTKPETADDDGDDELNNKEFARQLASLKEGKKFTAKSGNEKKKKKQKSVKQSQAKAAEPAPAKASPPPSTDDNDADDDQSPPRSPEVAAADASGVSDMLEAPAPGAGSLRIVPSEFTQPQKAKKQKHAAEPALTKKQRQRRKKAEASRAEADEAETDRKALMEKQRRLARISEGRAAKDGSQFMAANGKNAWKSGQPNGIAAEKPAADVAAAPLLDTFEKAAPAPAAKKAPAPAQSEGWKSAPSEEEQMERLKSETEADEWNTVTTKKSKKAATPTEEKTEAAALAKAPQAPQEAQPKAKAAPVANGKPAVASGYGAFSALTTEDPEEEEEVEWDV